MSMIKPDAEVLKSQIDHLRQDVHKLYPLLTLLEPTDRDQMSGFAERLLAFMAEIQISYETQAREFQTLCKAMVLIETKLDLLLEEQDPDD